jgi:hypothetical protein
VIAVEVLVLPTKNRSNRVEERGEKRRKRKRREGKRRKGKRRKENERKGNGREWKFNSCRKRIKKVKIN